jgi:hypothetical protein
MAFTPNYWVSGTVQDAAGGSVLADGMQVVFFESPETYASHYAVTTISGNDFSLNAFLFPAAVPVGTTFYVAIPNSNPEDKAKGYGADAIPVTIDGKGYVNIGEALVLTLGAGPDPAGMEPRPEIKLWIGGRLWQPTIYFKDGETTFVITPDPEIEAKISIAEGFLVSNSISSYSLVIDNQPPQVLSSTNMASKVYAASADEVQAFTLEYGAVEDEKLGLTEGVHTIKVSAASAGTIGPVAVATQLATVEVMGGPLRMLGTPLTWPSPYSISRDGTVTIQYGLSADANIEIQVVGVGGQRIKRFLINAGQEGGSAGINKITWDGTTDQGYKAGNAIYVGTIMSRDEGRLLGTFRLTIVD